jgi:hypothetical protein
MYLAGLLLATGASLALAGPASAAVSHTECDYPGYIHPQGYVGSGAIIVPQSNTTAYSGNTSGFALINHVGPGGLLF